MKPTRTLVNRTRHWRSHLRTPPEGRSAQVSLLRDLNVCGVDYCPWLLGSGKCPWPPTAAPVRLTFSTTSGSISFKYFGKK